MLVQFLGSVLLTARFVSTAVVPAAVIETKYCPGVYLAVVQHQFDEVTVNIFWLRVESGTCCIFSIVSNNLFEILALMLNNPILNAHGLESNSIV